MISSGADIAGLSALLSFYCLSPYYPPSEKVGPRAVERQSGEWRGMHKFLTAALVATKIAKGLAFGGSSC